MGAIFFIYAGYLLFVLIFPQYLNIQYIKIIALFMLPIVAYSGRLLIKTLRNTEKIEKQTKKLDEKNQMLNEKNQKTINLIKF